MGQEEALGRLEQFVEKLLERYNQLVDQHAEMNSLLESKDSEIAELKDRVDELQNDRSRMYERVTGLLDKIEKWESNFSGPVNALENGSEDREKDEEGRSDESNESPLFSVGGAQDPEPMLG